MSESLLVGSAFLSITYGSSSSSSLTNFCSSCCLASSFYIPIIRFFVARSSLRFSTYFCWSRFSKVERSLLFLLKSGFCLSSSSYNHCWYSWFVGNLSPKINSIARSRGPGSKCFLLELDVAGFAGPYHLLAQYHLRYHCHVHFRHLTDHQAFFQFFNLQSNQPCDVWNQCDLSHKDPVYFSTFFYLVRHLKIQLQMNPILAGLTFCFYHECEVSLKLFLQG